jgi:hypothetical protein
MGEPERTAFILLTGLSAMQRTQFTWDWHMGHEGLWVEFQPLIVLASSAEWLAKNPWRRKVENPVYRFPEQGGLPASSCFTHLAVKSAKRKPDQISPLFKERARSSVSTEFRRHGIPFVFYFRGCRLSCKIALNSAEFFLCN